MSITYAHNSLFVKHYINNFIVIRTDKVILKSIHHLVRLLVNVRKAIRFQNFSDILTQAQISYCWELRCCEFPNNKQQGKRGHECLSFTYNGNRFPRKCVKWYIDLSSYIDFNFWYKKSFGSKARRCQFIVLLILEWLI